MFGIGMPELMVILVVALIIFGPKKLPDLAKSLGKGFAEFKKASQDFKNSMDMEVDLEEKEHPADQPPSITKEADSVKTEQAVATQEKEESTADSVKTEQAAATQEKEEPPKGTS